MSCYRGDNPAFLRLALDSIQNQSLRPRQLVLVVDGPIPRESDAEIERFVENAEDLPVDVLRLPESRRLSGALNAGLPLCNFPWVARMDSDDICNFDRFKTQAGFLRDEPSVDLLASWHAEFFGSPENVLRYKYCAARHEGIARWLPWRNVVSHPTIVVRKSALEEIGGFRTDTGLFEDYDLFLRLLRAGKRFACLPKPLLRFRVSADHKKRRGGWGYAWLGIRLRLRWWREGLIGIGPALLGSIGLACFAVAPISAKEYLYRTVFRRSGL